MSRKEAEQSAVPETALEVNKCMHTNVLRVILFIRFLFRKQLSHLKWNRHFTVNKKKEQFFRFSSLITINPADNKSWLDSIKEKNPSTKMLSNVAQSSVESFLSNDNSQHAQNPWPAWGCTSLLSTAKAVMPLNCSSTSDKVWPTTIKYNIMA